MKRSTNNKPRPLQPKHLVIGGLALTALAVTVAVARAVKTGTNLEFELLPKFRKLDFDGLVIEADAKFKNPTSGSLTLKNPLITLSNTGKDGKAAEIMRLDLAGKAITISAKASGKLSDADQLGSKLLIKVPYTNIVQMAPDLLKAVLGVSKPYVLDVVTTANVEAPGLPPFKFTDKQSIAIKSPLA